MKKKVLLIGHYCATGGVSIHLRRLKNILKNDFIVNVIDESRLSDNDGFTFNIRNRQLLKYINFIRKSDIIHIHTTVAVMRFAHILFSRLFFKRTIVTIHSLTTIKSKKDLVFLKIVLKFAHKVIVVSEEINERLKLQNTKVIPAFLPPNFENEPELPNEIIYLLNKNKDKKIVVSNAYRLNLYKNTDLYGLDLLINVAKILKKNNKAIKIIFILTSLDVNRHLYDNYIKIIDEQKLEEQITLITYPISFVRLISNSDLVVRATNTDGDAITIREAIYLNKPIIASDIVVRPKKAILFKNRDVKDLYDKIISTMKQDEKGIEHQVTDYKSIYLDLYSQ